MAFRDEIGKRMKEYYEQISKTKLMRRVPVIIRIDGKAFHTYTRGFEKPFDEVLRIKNIIVDNGTSFATIGRQ